MFLVSLNKESCGILNCGFNVLQYSRSSSEHDKRNLFLVFFDYALYQINESCVSHGDTPYSFDEVFPIVAMLNVADAPEAFYISVKHGLDGIGEILRRSISEALMRFPNFDRLNTVNCSSICPFSFLILLHYLDSVICTLMQGHQRLISSILFLTVAGESNGEI